MSEQLKVSSSPHIRSKETTGNIMLWVIIALLPATFFGIYNFRDTHAWLLVIVTTAAAVLTEYIYEKLMHKKITIKDFSAAVTDFCLHSTFRRQPRSGWESSEVYSQSWL